MRSIGAGLTRRLATLAVIAAVGAATSRARAQGAGTWEFAPEEDRFGPECLLDLRGMNERVAGEHGFVRLSEDGESFVRGDGTPIRFWAANVGGMETLADAEGQLRFLAKKGVNMVRLHRSVHSHADGSSIADVDENEIDAIFRYVAAAGKNGVYVTISPYTAEKAQPKSWASEGYAGKQPWGLLMVEGRLKDAYKGWTRELFTRVNPYTGKALKDDPAVAVIQVMNEDSLLWWTFQRIGPTQKAPLQKRFGEWLAKKYGSLEKASAAWEGRTIKGDDLAGGMPAFYLTWNLTLEPPAGGEGRRMADQLQFLAEYQRAFYAEMKAHYRGLGCGQLVLGSNWKSADAVRMDDAERWTYGAGDVAAVDRYFHPVHVGNQPGWRIDPGDRYFSRSVLREPEGLVCSLKQTVGQPMLVLESNWEMPNLYQSEAPFLACAYQSLSGVDATYWFSMGSRQWLEDPRRMFWKVRDAGYALQKWSAGLPELLGMFPACAVAYRQGLIRGAAEPVVYERRPPEDLWARRAPVITEGAKDDPNRADGGVTPGRVGSAKVDPWAFLVGPVKVEFGGARETRAADLSRYVDRRNRVARSVTGEIEFDAGRGVCAVRADRFAGVCGFLKDAGGTFDLGAVRVTSDNSYATVAVVPMDGKQLSESGTLLVQVGTTARTSGWVSKPARFEVDDPVASGKKRMLDGEQIVRTGGPPWLVAETLATVRVRNGALTRATLLDPNGYSKREVPVRHEGEEAVVELPRETMYLLLR